MSAGKFGISGVDKNEEVIPAESQAGGIVDGDNR